MLLLVMMLFLLDKGGYKCYIIEIHYILYHYYKEDGRWNLRIEGRQSLW